MQLPIQKEPVKSYGKCATAFKMLKDTYINSQDTIVGMNPCNSLSVFLYTWN